MRNMGNSKRGLTVDDIRGRAMSMGYSSYSNPLAALQRGLELPMCSRVTQRAEFD